MRTDTNSQVQAECLGFQCTVEKTLPFAGPLVALIGMLIVAATATTTVVMMAG